jgi:hypothetical protein
MRERGISEVGIDIEERYCHYPPNAWRKVLCLTEAKPNENARHERNKAYSAGQHDASLFKGNAQSPFGGGRGIKVANIDIRISGRQGVCPPQHRAAG